MSISTKRACDACRSRRTKCTGDDPCTRCVTAELNCTYLQKPKKKGPAGRIISEIRASQEQQGPSEAYPPDLLASMTTELTESYAPAEDVDIMELLGMNPHLVASQLPNPSSEPSSSKLASQNLAPSLPLSPCHTSNDVRFLRIITPLLDTSIRSYFERFHPLCPIVDPTSTLQRFGAGLHLTNRPFAALILALAALDMLLPNNQADSEGRADEIMDEAIRLHSTSDLGMNPSLEQIATTLSIGSYLKARKGTDAAYLKTKEAIGLAEIMQLHKTAVYAAFSDSDKEIALRIYWILGVAERSTSLLHQKPLSLRSRMSDLQNVLPALSPLSLRLRPITLLFDQVDADVIDCINGDCSTSRESGECGFDILRALQIHQQLEDIRLEDSLSDVQVVDVCISHALLTQNLPLPTLRIEYPFYAMMEIWEEIGKTRFAALEGNGRCLGIKIRFIAEAALMVLNLPHTVTLPATISSTADLYIMAEEIRTLSARLIDCSRWIRFEKSP